LCELVIDTQANINQNNIEMKTNYWKESTYWKLYLAAVAIVIILTIVI